MPTGNSPYMRLPAHVDGFIDLKTLADIHRFLNQSELEEDLALAAWVKEHYLYDPIKSDGREIRTTEGFSKLDRAYRRVRSLTNKAQDKWPFFDRNWKSMSSTTVRNNARGEAAPGVSLPGMSNSAHDSPMSSAQDARCDENSPAASAFVAFGTNNPVRHQPSRGGHHQDIFARPIPNTPVPLPGSKKSQLKDHADFATRQDDQELPQSAPQSQLNSTQDSSPHSSPHSKTSMSAHSGSAGDVETEGAQAPFEELASRSTSATAFSEAPQTSDTIKSATDDVTPDDGGKVRGPNGRFMSKEEARLMIIARSKSAKKSRFAKKEAADAQGVGPSSSLPDEFDDTTMADTPSTPAPAIHSGSSIQDGSDGGSVPAGEDDAPGPVIVATDAPSDRSDNEPASSPSQRSLSISSSTLAYTLAAEADPVPSNLDRLPPLSFLRKLKRKSESTVQDGPRRKRGRPRLSEQRRLQTETDVTGAAEQPSAPSETVQEEAPRMATRRSTRRSGVANMDQPTPAKATPLPPSTKAPAQTEDQKDATMVDAGNEDVDADQKAPLPTPVLVKPPSQRITRAKASAVIETSSQSAPSMHQDASDKENIDVQSPALAKASSSTKRSGAKKTAVTEPVTDVSATPNGTSKTPAKPEAKSVTDTLSQPEPTPASLPVDSTPPDASLDDAATTQGRGKVDFFARVHTATGIVEVPVDTDDLSDDVEIIQKYAEWSKKEKVPIDYHAFKSIFGFAKKG